MIDRVTTAKVHDLWKMLVRMSKTSTISFRLFKWLRTDTILLWIGYQRPVESAPIFKILLSLEWHKHEYRLDHFNPPVNYSASTLLALQPTFFKLRTNRQCQKKAEWGLQPSVTKQRIKWAHSRRLGLSTFMSLIETTDARVASSSVFTRLFSN